MFITLKAKLFISDMRCSIKDQSGINQPVNAQMNN